MPINAQVKGQRSCRLFWLMRIRPSNQFKLTGDWLKLKPCQRIDLHRNTMSIASPGHTVSGSGKLCCMMCGSSTRKSSNYFKAIIYKRQLFHCSNVQSIAAGAADIFLCSYLSANSHFELFFWQIMYKFTNIERYAARACGGWWETINQVCLALIPFPVS